MTISKAMYSVLAIALIVVVWQAVVVGLHVSFLILPSPSMVFAQGFLPNLSIFPKAVFVTTYEVALGFVTAAFLGILLAIGIYHSSRLSSAIYPVLVFTQIIPKVALFPLILVWFGLGVASKIVLIFLVAFFPIMIDSISGFVDTPKEMLDLADASRVGKVKRFRLVVLPWSLPRIFSGLRVGITLAVIGAIIGEFVQSTEGLGFLILQSQYTLNMPLMFASLLVTTLLGAALYGGVQLAEMFSLPWYVQMRRKK